MKHFVVMSLGKTNAFKAEQEQTCTNLEEELAPMFPVSQRTPLPLGYRACTSISFMLK